jgi:hypothetical protein
VIDGRDEGDLLQGKIVKAKVARGAGLDAQFLAGAPGGPGGGELPADFQFRRLREFERGERPGAGGAEQLGRDTEVERGIEPKIERAPRLVLRIIGVGESTESAAAAAQGEQLESIEERRTIEEARAHAIELGAEYRSLR